MNVKIEPGWHQALSDQWEMPYFSTLAGKVRTLYAGATSERQIFPPASKIFRAFDLCAFDDVKVVILGQDPYHRPGQANGLAFSVGKGIALPPSLVNIFKEIKADTGQETCVRDGDLTAWATQGVLLLNSTLTVEQGHAGSHQSIGWEQFTDAAVKALSDRKEGLVFMLWGSYAIAKGRVIDRSRHLVLTAPHPSPLSAYRGFFGCHHFSRANSYLESQGKTPVKW